MLIFDGEKFMVGNVPNRSVVKSGLRDDLSIIVDYTLSYYGKNTYYVWKMLFVPNQMMQI